MVHDALLLRLPGAFVTGFVTFCREVYHRPRLLFGYDDNIIVWQFVLDGEVRCINVYPGRVVGVQVGNEKFPACICLASISAADIHCDSLDAFHPNQYRTGCLTRCVDPFQGDNVRKGSNASLSVPTDPTFTVSEQGILSGTPQRREP